jgi:hypothetical protein
VCKPLDLKYDTLKVVSLCPLGSRGEQRLASLLLPKFVAKIPDSGESVVLYLIGLSPVPSRLHRPDLSFESSALHILGSVCGVTAHSPESSAFILAVEHLLR